jgi:hypothetical protein
MNNVFYIFSLMLILVTTGCSSLSPQEETRYHKELANVKDLDRAVEIFKIAEWMSPLEKEAMRKTIIILRNTELPKAKTADDYIALHDRLCWGMTSIRNDILRYAVLNLKSVSEIDKIMRITQPHGKIYMLAFNRIRKIEEDRIKQE